MTENAPQRRHRGSPLVYGLAFLLLLGSIAFVLVGTRDFFESLTPLWVSVWLSAGAILLAIVAQFIRRRR